METVISDQMFYQLFLAELQQLNKPTIEDTLELHSMGVSAYSTIESERI